MRSLADVGPCAECKRPNCPTLLAQIHGTGGDEFTWRDRDEAEIGCLKAQLAAERARAGAAERERAAFTEILDPAEDETLVQAANKMSNALCDHERQLWKPKAQQARRDLAAAESRATEEAAHGAALRAALQWAMKHVENVFALTAHSDPEWPSLERARALLALPAAESIARVQALVEAARNLMEAWKSQGGGVQVSPIVAARMRAFRAALDAFTGTTSKGDGNG